MSIGVCMIYLPPKASKLASESFEVAPRSPTEMVLQHHTWKEIDSRVREAKWRLLLDVAPWS